MKTKYLQAMGIQAWRLREQNAEEREESIYRLISKNRKQVILIVHAAQPREQQLLTALFKALQAEVETIQSFAANEVIISLGPHPDPNIKSTYSLSEMLAQPGYKADVWKILQSITSPVKDIP